jgi:protein-S-isoprenylcysteine O-methyltransferase Ste14
MLGFLVQWPTLLTALMFPLLVWMYARLAREEEREARVRFGNEYTEYESTTPRFIPNWRIGREQNCRHE